MSNDLFSHQGIDLDLTSANPVPPFSYARWAESGELKSLNKALNSCHFAKEIVQSPRKYGVAILDVSVSNVEESSYLIKRSIDECFSAYACSSIFIKFNNKKNSIIDIFDCIRNVESIVISVEPFLNHEMIVEPIDGIMFRVFLGNGSVCSWPLLFGPKEYFPPSRRSDEWFLVLKTARRPLNVNRELMGKNPLQVHLADIPTNMNQEKFSIRWKLTEASKLRVNKSDEDMRLAKARYTTVVPRRITKEVFGWKF